jgi:hypothetical protein
VLERAAAVDQYVDYARFCADLHQQDKGRRYRALAGLGDAIPGEDDLSNFRKRFGAQAIEVTMAVVVELFRTFGLLKGELVSTDGQLEPCYSRLKGCAYACEGCQALPLDEASRQELGRQLHNGAQRLQLIRPFPDVVAKVRQATTKKGMPTDPKVALLEIEAAPTDQASPQDPQHVATLLSLPEDQVPDLRLQWCRLRRGPQGELLGRCPHRSGVQCDSQRMTFTDHPRLIGPIQRGTPAWQHLYGARTASERTNGYDQEVIANGRSPWVRGLKALRFAGTIRTLAHLLCRALPFVLDVTYTLNRPQLAQT